MPRLEKVCREEASLLSHTDPLLLELNRLQNQLKEKERDIGNANSEIRELKAANAKKDKALERFEREVKALDEKLNLSEKKIEQKNLEIKKLIDVKKEALAAQYAVETTLRRVYSDRKNNNRVHIESFIAPVASELKVLKHEFVAVQEDKRALERLMKSEEATHVEAENIQKNALERALLMVEYQNQNFQLRRRSGILQEENKLLEKINRQKVFDIEKLSQTIKELEEAILTGGAVANAIRDYRRQIVELNEEKRNVERELAKFKVSANRTATLITNDSKYDDNDKVVKICFEEKRILQMEIRKLKDKLMVSNRAARANSRVNEKLKLRLVTLEEGLKDATRISRIRFKDSEISKSSNSSKDQILSLWGSRNNKEIENDETNEACVVIEGDETTNGSV